MGRYIIRRVVYAIPVILIASIIVFTVIHITTPPRPPARSAGVTQEALAEYAHHLGLDKPGWQQYLIWLNNFIHLDWGTSIVTGRPVLPDIQTALVNSLILGIAATVVSLSVGITLGVYSALHQYSPGDHLMSGAAFMGISMPTFWLALLMQILFGFYFTQWFHLSEPMFYTAGMYKPGAQGESMIDLLRHMVLPVIVISVQVIAVYSRYMRASMLEILQSDFLRTARSKGIREKRVIVRHAMRNALIPITTQVAIDLGAIASGLIVTETIFQWPGMGPLFIEAVDTGDYPVVLAWVMVTVFFVIVFNLIADILYAVLDPRIRYA
jgi:peptide/nickel transport system permease protein